MHETSCQKTSWELSYDHIYTYYTILYHTKLYDKVPNTRNLEMPRIPMTVLIAQVIAPIVPNQRWVAFVVYSVSERIDFNGNILWRSEIPPQRKPCFRTMPYSRACIAGSKRTPIVTAVSQC